VGSLSASLVHPREVYKPALLYSASSVAVAHNHPSGDPEPSREDKEFAQRLAKAGQLLGIKVLDHIILGDEDWVSLRGTGDI
jgi:DNA repair protein RadC